MDGVSCYDELLKLTDPKLVVFEMDCGWVFASGHNPVDYLIKTAGAVPADAREGHDSGSGWQGVMTVLGKGVVDYGPIMRAATGLKLLH